MKIKYILISVFFCFFAFTASTFALSNTNLATLINDSSSISDQAKPILLANVNSAKYVATSSGVVIVPATDLSSYTGVKLKKTESGYLRFSYGNGLYCNANAIFLSEDGSSIKSYQPGSMYSFADYYTNSILCDIPGTNFVGGLELFLAPTESQTEAPQAVKLRELIQEPSGNLMSHFGVTSTTLLIAGITIFCLLLVVPLIPRLVRLFL